MSINIDDIVADSLKTPKGKRLFKKSFQLAAAKAADHFKDYTFGYHLARSLAGLPLKRQYVNQH
jgi:hypothetical protein